MLGLEVQMVDETNAAEAPRDENGLLRRPCLEEFVSSGYKAEQYDTYFGENYGPGWSNPNWVKPGEEGPGLTALLAGLPSLLHVRSQVRKVATRTTRAIQPTRHRFKQYLFSNPSKRLTRARPVCISAQELLQNLDELLAHESVGRLSVHTPDGRRLDLAKLKAGTPVLSAAAVVPAMYNRPLDSIANDLNSGNPLPTYVDGTFPGDPAAQRAMDRLVAEKRHEAIRQGATKEDVPAAPSDPVDPEEPVIHGEGPAEVTQPTGDAQDSADEVLASEEEKSTAAEPSEPAETQEEPAAEEEVPSSPAVVDPAANRSSSRKRHRR